jgi:beta-glucosidase
MKRLLFMVLLSATMLSAQKPVDVEALLRRMTLEEKVGQMAQVTVDILMDHKTFQLKDSMLRKGIVDYHIGSVLNTWDNVSQTPADWNRVVKALQQYTRKTRLGIPLIYGVDAIHGASYTLGATLFPQQIAQAATFNRQLVREGAEICAYETRACSLPWTFSPVLDLGVDPRWARLWETFGEDPYLASALAVEMVHGYQGVGFQDIDGKHLAACAKHFLGYSVPVSGKDRTPAYLPENVLREYHLPAFQAAVDAGLASIMVNSGLINGEPVHASHHLLTDLLKNELGFEGVVVTDWNDIENLYRRDRVAASPKDAVRMAIHAGIDMSMIPYDFLFCDYLIELVKEGAVPMSRIDDATRRILKMKQRLGLFEKPYADVTAYPDFACPAYRDKSYQTAAEAITLLKNEQNLLPLSKGTKLLVTGPNANSMRSLIGGWSYSWQGEKTPAFTADNHTLLEALQKAFGENNVTYTPGVSYVENGTYWQEQENSLSEAVKAAAQADVVILCLGENSYTEKPGDLQDLYLSDLQTKLAQALAATGKPVVLVLNEGRPRIISRFEGEMKAVVMTYLPGNFGGDALADVLTGKVNPSGKLPFNYPRYPQSLIPYWHKYAEEQVKAEGLYDYESDYSPQYEFGTGMSYTTFQYKNLTLSSNVLTTGDELGVSVEVTNTGTVEGKESVLLYLSDLVASLAPDMRRLKGFEKISLKPGETQTVHFVLTLTDMSFVNLDNRTTTEPGAFQVQVGPLKAGYTLK